MTEGKSNRAKVTVVCITYNHEKYIAQALDSFVAQKTDFDFVVYVGDDGSKDGTRAIISDYANRYPDLVVPFFREENLGPQRNALELCERASSEYIAFCDGDDYWIDDYKLQKQYDYLQENPDYRFCLAHTEILPSDYWPEANYYIKNDDGKYIIPECLPGFKSFDPPYYAADLIKFYMIGHSSTMFFRWNSDIEFPSWINKGNLGDIFIRLLQLDDGQAFGSIEDVVSVYRINETGVFSSFDDRDARYMATRLEYISKFNYMLDWYKEHTFEENPKNLIVNAIKKEGINYIKACLRTGRAEALAQSITEFSDEFNVILQYLVSADDDRKRLENVLGWGNYQYVVRNDLAYPRLSKVAGYVKRKLFFNGYRLSLKQWYSYWLYALFPKKKNLWVVSGFRKQSYLDNTRYFYESVLSNHPEVDIYWATADSVLYKELSEQGKPTILFGSKECKRILSRAAVAVIDHYAFSDLDRPSGHNARTKIVQLWHGAGFKSVIKGDQITANEPSFVFSSDIVSNPSDNIFAKIFKAIKMFRLGFRRELFEKYFLFLTPGQEMVERMAIPLNIPESSWLKSGYPRLDPLYKNKTQPTTPKVVYAPTYRWDPDMEESVIQGFIAKCPDIQEKMNLIDGEFVIRLHPHSWRDYKAKILSAINQFSRISFDSDKDPYTGMATCSMMISDYSSIAIDFAITGRPTLYFCPDFEEYRNKDTGLIADYQQRIPGPFVQNWDELLEIIAAHCVGDSAAQEYRERLSYFYEPETTDRHNNDRIVEEIFKRLSHSKRKLRK